MNIRALSSAYVFFLVCSACCALAQSNKLDITLEGPWILFEDLTFANRPVLIAMAPGMNHIPKPNRHQQPTFSAGDGYWIPTGVSCAAFDGVCAPKGATGPLTSTGYPDTYPLRVAVPSGWTWYKEAGNTEGTYLILPMPDSYSNDGLWPMQFAPKSDVNGKGYAPDGSKNHSIGVQLHYDSLPGKISLIPCQLPLSADDDSTCDKSLTKNEPLDNSGTLRITMKAPNIDDVCDRHVRAAYRQMLLLLDPTSLDRPIGPGSNVNQKRAYIDPARTVDSNGPSYDDQKLHCRKKWDPKTLRSESFGAGAINRLSAMPSDDQNLSVRINNIIVAISNPDLPRLDFNGEEITAAAHRLDPRFPRVSQLAILAELVHLSLATIEGVQVRRNAKPPGERGIVKGSISQPSEPALNALEKLRKAEEGFISAYTVQTKDGKDCRAVTMLVD
jgi:hypothetical protein